MLQPEMDSAYDTNVPHRSIRTSSFLMRLLFALILVLFVYVEVKIFLFFFFFFLKSNGFSNLSCLMMRTRKDYNRAINFGFVS